ncbi:hypothetical protein MLD52_10365 [Puniceicoccaceae bacterium K14]|nr:hypothetical protein [Puniceicoccaceae bacterium K14]
MEISSRVRPIPTLPIPLEAMSWRNLNVFRHNQRGPDFYLECLRYAQFLWLRELPARAILCLDRALGADLNGSECCLDEFPLPYAALAEMLKESPQEVFIGNPRVHFQHYADRLGPPRKEVRKWRAWACWAITRTICPDLPADPKHDVIEPKTEAIDENLKTLGHPNESQLWKSALK